MRKIQLLDSSLYEDKKTLKKLSYWFKLMNKPNGWHYDLDHLWILKELKKHKIKPGDTILDAGAGQGILQYFLCSKGYNVISLDFSPRLIPEKTKGIFKIHGDGNSKINYSHDYMEVISYGDGFNGGTLQKRSVLEKLKKTFGSDVYESWIKNVDLKREFNHYVVLSAPTRFVRDWIVSRYADKILDQIKSVKKSIERIEFIIAEEQTKSSKSKFKCVQSLVVGKSAL